MELKLVVLEGAKQGLEIPLKKDKFLIGRAKECALRAGSEAISRRHCAILRVKDQWAVRDLGSRNGTYVNDKRIEKPARLNPGDELRVGPLKFRVSSVAATEPDAGPASSTVQQGKPHKKPPVKDVGDVVERTIGKAEGAATEDDVFRWLLGSEGHEDATLKETRSIRLEETGTHKRVPGSVQTALEDGTKADAAIEQQAEPPAEIGLEVDDDSSGAWNMFRRGKTASKKQPGKLPPRPEEPSKNSREAAADILREITRRR